MTIVYVDVVVLENIFLNAIILYATGMWLKKKNYIKRILVASFIGAIFSFLNYGKLNPTLVNVGFKIVISLLMVRVAFPIKKIKELLQTVLFFYLVSFLFGGCALMWALILQPDSTWIENGVWQINSSLFTILSSTLIGIVLWKVGLEMIHRKEKKRIYDLEIAFQGKRRIIKAFLDTGNGLKDPVTQEGIVIIEKEVFEELSEISVDGIWNCNFTNGEENLYKIRWIPFQSIGKKKGILLAVQVEKISVLEEEINLNQVLVGIYEGHLSKNKEYQALIGPDLLERRKRKDGFIKNFEETRKLFKC